MSKEIPVDIVAAIKEQEFLHSQLSVTEIDYRAAVLLLVGVAQNDTSNARVAAQVLLSLYNGYEYHVDLTDLGLLDYKILQAALIAIRGRIFVSVEPHEIIEDGQAIFKRLAQQWTTLHVDNRNPHVVGFRLRKEVTESAIKEAIQSLKKTGKKVTKVEVARLVGISREHVSKSYGYLFPKKDRPQPK
jgi:hypothetical protein